jgi:hypothetical protein
LPGRSAKIVELFGRVNGEKLGSRPLLNLVRQSLDQVAGKQRCRALVSEALNHNLSHVPENGTFVKGSTVQATNGAVI